MSTCELHNTIQNSIIQGNLFLGIISLIFSIIVIVWFFCVNSLRSLTYYFLLCISISEIIGSIAQIINSVTPQTINISILWIFINFMELFCDSSTLIFLAFLCYTIYSLVKMNNKELADKKTMFIIIGFSCSFAYSGIVVLVDHFLQKRNHNIIIKALYYFNNETNFTMKLIHQIAMTIIIVVILFYVINLVIFIRQRAKEDPLNAEKILSVCRTLYNFPIVGSIGFIFTWFVLVLNFSLSFKESSTQVRVFNAFSLFGNLFTVLRGLFVFLIFISTKKVQYQISQKKERFLRNIQRLNMFQIPNSGFEMRKKSLLK